MIVSRWPWRRAWGLVLAFSLIGAGGCSAFSGQTGQQAPSTPASAAQLALDQMTLAQRVGQLFMVGTTATAVNSYAAEAITADHVGSVILTPASYGGVNQVFAVTSQLQQLTGPSTTGGTKLFVATDQEGGAVQHLQGPGFSPMPSALTQGTWAPRVLKHWAKVWGSELHAAGVNLNLAPVADTVPANFPPAANQPIGSYGREYGYTPAVVGAHVVAVVEGMHAKGVDTTLKHFPGLGRVLGNTDVTAGVAETLTTSNDPYFGAFEDGIAAGAQFVLMSTAIYQRLDPGVPAAFSPYIIETLLRGHLHFKGVVISDALTGAAQVESVPLALRAVYFIEAGGDIALVTLPQDLSVMYNKVLSLAKTNAAFRQKVDTAALTVLTAKSAAGLL